MKTKLLKNMGIDNLESVKLIEIRCTSSGCAIGITFKSDKKIAYILDKPTKRKILKELKKTNSFHIIKIHNIETNYFIFRKEAVIVSLEPLEPASFPFNFPFRKLIRIAFNSSEINDSNPYGDIEFFSDSDYEYKKFLRYCIKNIVPVKFFTPCFIDIEFKYINMIEKKCPETSLLFKLSEDNS